MARASFSFLGTPSRKYNPQTLLDFAVCKGSLHVPAILNTSAYHTKPVVHPEQRGGSSFAVKLQTKRGF